MFSKGRCSRPNGEPPPDRSPPLLNPCPLAECSAQSVLDVSLTRTWRSKMISIHYILFLCFSSLLWFVWKHTLRKEKPDHRVQQRQTRWSQPRDRGVGKRWGVGIRELLRETCMMAIHTVIPEAETQGFPSSGSTSVRTSLHQRAGYRALSCRNKCPAGGCHQPPSPCAQIPGTPDGACRACLYFHRYHQVPSQS